MSGLAKYYFMPSLRQGLNSFIQNTREQQMAAQLKRPKLSVELHVQSDSALDGGTIPRDIELFGPGDVRGFDSRIVTRTDPLNNVGDFEPNYFPAISFADPDFPWRFSGAAPDANGKLIPWITLIVLRAERLPDGTAAEFEEEASRSPDKLAWIKNVNRANLPDLTEAWRWAHVQLTADDSPQTDMPTKLNRLIRTEPERTVSRLLCARRLRPGVKYAAFVVPTFKIGCLAGRGEDSDLNTSAYDLAWHTVEQSAPGEPLIIDLPYYYKWEFRTGRRGDFEYLVRLLEPRPLTGLGKRDMDCKTPGFGLAFSRREDARCNILELEGALKSIDTEFTPWGKDPKEDEHGNLLTYPPSGGQAALANLINQPTADTLSFLSTDTPKVAPPIYGRWHRARSSVNTESVAEDGTALENDWLDELNLDPRHRTAAGFGSEVIRQQQESLMASAWKQVGSVLEANELLRRAQTGRESSRSIQNRIEKLTVEDYLRITAPVHSKVLFGSAGTVYKQFQERPVLPPALDPAFRRIFRKRGSLMKRKIKEKPRPDILERLNSDEVKPAGPHPDLKGMPGICDITKRMIELEGIRQELDESRLFCEKNITCELIKEVLPGAEPEKEADKSGVAVPETDDVTTGKAICEALNGELYIDLESPKKPKQLELSTLAEFLRGKLDPEITIVNRIAKRLDLLDIPERRDPLHTIMAAPEFPQPMYEPLRDISQELLLPGIEKVPQNTIALLETNGRFVESYMCGLNHEFAGELLWREYPTDQRGSYFRQFWDVSGYMPTDSDVEAALNKYRALTLVEKKRIQKRNEERLHGLTGPRREDAIKNLVLEEYLSEKLKDIAPLHTWKINELGMNDNRPEDGEEGRSESGEEADGEENLVLIVRGDLLKKYPNAVIYAVQAQKIDDSTVVPALEEYLKNENEDSDEPDPAPISPPRYPIFSGTLKPDITFLGFDMTPEEAWGCNGADGWYFVIEQRVSEARFGMDEPGPNLSISLDKWNNLSWSHIPAESVPSIGTDSAMDVDAEALVAAELETDYMHEDDYIDDKCVPGATDPDQPDWIWNSSSADIASITCQSPVRIIVRARQMLLKEEIDCPAAT